MSIYSEYEHGYITEAEFNSAAYREYAGEGDCGEGDDVPTSSDITNCLEAHFCDDCEGWCDGEYCADCLVNKTINAVEGGKL